MKNFNIACANFLAILIQAAIYAVAYIAGVYCLFHSYEAWGAFITALLLPVVAFKVAILLIFETFILRFIIPKPRPGVSKCGGGAHFLYQLNKKIFNLAIQPAFPPLAALYKISDCFRILILKSQGANIRFSSNVARTARIHDPFLLTVGSEAAIGEEVQIFSSAFEGDKLLLFRVFIGPKAHVGPSSLLFPGTEIGEGSVLGMGSSSRNEMKIPAYELWVGNPAGHLTKLSRPMLYTAAAPTAPVAEREYTQGPRNFRDRGDRGGRGPRERDPRDRGGDRGGRGGDRDRRGGRDRYDRGGRPSNRPFQRRPDQQSQQPVRPPQQATPASEAFQAPQAPVAQEPTRPPVVEQVIPPTPIESVRHEIIVPTVSNEKPYIGPIDLPVKPAEPAKKVSTEPSAPSSESDKKD